MAFKIYTKTGDKGTTGLIGGSRVSKSNERIQVCGDLDELNAHIGMISDLNIQYSEISNLLRSIQNDIFCIGAWVTLDPKKKNHTPIPELSEDNIKVLELAIDTMEETLPQMTHFILPGGHPTVSEIHIARAVCRRAERELVHLSENENVVNVGNLLCYLNRLSDYLFVLGRFVAKKMNVEEIKWTPNV
ncbi:cob(I)yrinic acid a,c-diamide adenosyltransferase [Rhizosphaericola mali]|uniref:Corrinoid adenosyltransferase n=1 Tax=Rhizosphaericola mali TaxID=2545455 RepID=A0A5P2G3Q0_9BACT|nr:cob(I)yrinic acid a,c-diamide adenosyltransferase [Rhizosphaericola mali]QES90454.1 cob(I)yrinic acid a,c-diamide adenosyltransferase [Rhizosphaericola mali]